MKPRKPIRYRVDDRASCADWQTIIVLVLLKCVSTGDVNELREFLREVDLTLAGLDSPTVRLWTERDETGAIIGSTGYELSEDGKHALIRSVAVAPAMRTAGTAARFAMHALEQAAASGASRAWLFSRRSGPFWQKLGFEPGDRDELAEALSETHQVRLFVESGQLGREFAWSRSLEDLRR